MNELGEFKERMTKQVFNISLAEAKEKGVCIDCKKPALERCYSEAGKREYQISGLCEKCFDRMYGIS